MKLKMAEQNNELETVMACDGAPRTDTPLDSGTDAMDANITLPCSETPASNDTKQMKLLDNCGDSPTHNSEIDDSADSLENQEFLSAESDSESATSKEIYVDIYEDVSLSEEANADPTVISNPPVVRPSVSVENETSDRSSTPEDRRRDQFFITAHAQWEAMKTFSDASIRTIPTNTSLVSELLY